MRASLKTAHSEVVSLGVGCNKFSCLRRHRLFQRLSLLSDRIRRHTRLSNPTLKQQHSPRVSVFLSMPRSFYLSDVSLRACLSGLNLRRLGLVSNPTRARRHGPH